MAGGKGSQGAGSWDIKALEATETATGAELPGNIVPINGPFTLKATFNGSGSFWSALVAAKANYEVYFYVEGLGKGAPENDYGPTKGSLKTGDNVATYDVPGLPQGVYMVSCLVRVSPGSGVNGFNQDLIVEAA